VKPVLDLLELTAMVVFTFAVIFASAIGLGYLLNQVIQ